MSAYSDILCVLLTWLRHAYVKIAKTGAAIENMNKCFLILFLTIP